MQEAGFLPELARKQPRRPAAFDASKPPVPGARLGRDRAATPPGSFRTPTEPGKYMKLETAMSTGEPS